MWAKWSLQAKFCLKQGSPRLFRKYQKHSQRDCSCIRSTTGRPTEASINVKHTLKQTAFQFRIAISGKRHAAGRADLERDKIKESRKSNGLTARRRWIDDEQCEGTLQLIVMVCNCEAEPKTSSSGIGPTHLLSPAKRKQHLARIKGQLMNREAIRFSWIRHPRMWIPQRI